MSKKQIERVEEMLDRYAYMFGPKHVPAMGGAGYRFVDGNYMAFNVGSGKTFTQVNIKKVVNSATLPKRGGETIVGHALQKHAGRNPHIWGKVKRSEESRV